MELLLNCYLLWWLSSKYLIVLIFNKIYLNNNFTQ